MAATPVAAQVAAQVAGTQDRLPTVSWLGGSPPERASGVSWGVPWTRGSVRSGQQFSLTGPNGTSLPLQSWNLAYWPDGSVKWTGFATVAGPGNAGEFHLGTGQSAAPAAAVRVTDGATSIDIDTGVLKCRIGRRGAALIETMTIDGREIARNGRLLCSLEDRSQLDSSRTIRFQDFVSEIKKTTVEQSGPVRATVKIEGFHKSADSAREWLPFVVRLYFYAGQEDVRAVHTIVFDGDHEKDYISALGLVFDVPLREQVHNRHVRFTGEGEGVWAESTQPVRDRSRTSILTPSSRLRSI